MKTKVFLLILIISFSISCSLSGRPEHRLIGAKDGIIKIGLSELKDKKAYFFTYLNGKKRINFIVIKNQDGVWTAFDACNECYSRKLGYRQDRDSIICKYCGNRFGLEKIREGFGSCIPVRLNSSSEMGFLIIKVKDLLEGEKYF